MPEAAPTSRLMVLMFTDIVGSTDLKRKHGDSEVAKMIRRHDEIFRYTVGAFPFAEILKDVGDGFLARFNSASDAVHAALHFQSALHNEKWAHPIKTRVGLHLGEVSELEREPTSGQMKLSGLAVDIAARVMGLALPGQILMTRAAFDNARQYVREHQTSDGTSPAVTRKWMAHGRYLFKGAEEPLEIFEVGEMGIAPLNVPPDTDKARRAVAADQEETLGWRPAVGLDIPDRKGWVLERKLGEGGFGEVWLGEYTKTKTPRVFKFCFDADRLRSFKRELVLFRLLRQALGDRSDIAKLYEIQLEKAPFYLECEFTEQGSLVEWSQAQGGIAKVPMATRLDIVARTAVAVAAAHSVGVLHKDIKPSNILIYMDESGVPRPRLTDFGIGVLTDPSQLAQRNITMMDMSSDLVDGNESSRTGTRIYAPPEALMGKPFTMQGDVYALGILLYQMAVGDLERPLAQGWEREVADPQLREDITACVEGHESERLSNAKELADRINSLPARRRARTRRRVARISVAASIVLALLASSATVLAVRENRLRVAAVLERDKATAMNEFLQKILGSVEPRKGEGRDAKVVDQLDKALNDIDEKFEDQPEIAADLQATVGHGYKQLGLYDEAQDPLERALKTRRNLSAKPTKELAQNLEDLAAVFYWQAKYEEAENFSRDALDMRRGLFGDEHKDVATSLNYLAACIDQRGEHKKAEELYLQALAMRRRVLGEKDQDVAATMSNLTSCLLKQGPERYAQAEKLSRDALSMVEEVLPPDHIDIANAHSGLAFALNRKGDAASREEAIAHMTTALVIKRKVYGDENPKVATALQMLSDSLVRAKRHDEAKPLCKEALDIRRKKLRPEHPDIATSSQRLGEILMGQDNYSEAEPLLREAMRIRWTEDQGVLPDTQIWLGHCLTMLKRYEDAEPILHSAFDSLQKSLGEQNHRTQKARDLLHALYQAWEKPDKAKEWEVKAADKSATAVKSP